MEQLPQTQEKLTHEEKLLFAFCVVQYSCINILDEETQQVMTGLGTFTSIKRIESEYALMRQQEPERFEITRQVVYDPSRGNFGYSPDNPIPATSVQASYAYLRRLRGPKGEGLNIARMGARRLENGAIIDMYRITWKGTGLFAGQEEKRTCYIYPYANENVCIAPDGMRLV